MKRRQLGICWGCQRLSTKFIANLARAMQIRKPTHQNRTTSGNVTTRASHIAGWQPNRVTDKRWQPTTNTAVCHIIVPVSPATATRTVSRIVATRKRTTMARQPGGQRRLCAALLGAGYDDRPPEGVKTRRQPFRDCALGPAIAAEGTPTTTAPT
jgi:hypothetical protein